MLGYVQTVTLDKKNILYQGKERPAKTKWMPAKLRAVLACVGSDSAQCQSTLDFRKYFENSTNESQIPWKLRCSRAKKLIKASFLCFKKGVAACNWPPVNYGSERLYLAPEKVWPPVTGLLGCKASRISRLLVKHSQPFKQEKHFNLNLNQMLNEFLSLFTKILNAQNRSTHSTVNYTQ